MNRSLIEFFYIFLEYSTFGIQAYGHVIYKTDLQLWKGNKVVKI
jgi:hypothetical protein